MKKDIGDNIVKSLTSNKSFWLGIAIISIVLYHMPRVYSLLNVFNPGFIGVDFFLFFSGFSLCYSFEKNNLSVFYKRRFLRIYPMFFVLSLTLCVLSVCRGGQLSLFDWFCNLTTLSYYKIGGFFIDWYLCSIFLFYLLFPVFYYLTKRFQWMVSMVVTIVVFILVSYYDIDWWYGCAIGRLPIFCLGVLCFLDKSNKKKNYFTCSLFYLITFFISVVLIYKKGAFMRGYFLTDMITPSLLIILSYFLYKMPSIVDWRTSNIVSTLGQYTLEIYVANVITMALIKDFSRTIEGWLVLLLYFGINILIAIVLVIINKRIKMFAKI